MSFIHKIKLCILNLFSKYHQLILKIKGIKMGSGCFVNKAPYIRMAKGSQIILGDNVTITSNRRHNPLLEHPAVLRTLSPDAIIEMKQNSGMSGASLICANRISVGEYTIIGPGTLIYDSEGHNYDKNTGWSKQGTRTGRPITIGKKCFIGARCIILSGVTIGNNCVISAGSVISQNIPDGHKASGNPATYTPLPKMLGGIGKINKNRA